jgi:hypothetical protein
LSRVINTNSVGKRRNQLLRAIVISIREMMKKSEIDNDAKDLAAFISMGLLTVHETVEETVTPWEKRDYWVKADRFRMEWAWTQSLGQKMLEATLGEDWAQVAGYLAEVGQKLAKVQVSERHRMGKPWIGSWRKLQNSDYQK